MLPLLVLRPLLFTAINTDPNCYVHVCLTTEIYAILCEHTEQPLSFVEDDRSPVTDSAHTPNSRVMAASWVVCVNVKDSAVCIADLHVKLNL